MRTFQKRFEKVFAAGETVLVSASSFSRIQKVLYELKLMQDDGSLSKKVLVYPVSLYANATTALYQKESAKKGEI
jgi:metallo-beta-lactamase family protein